MINGVEQAPAFFFVFDIGVDEQAVTFRVYVFHGDLKPVECTGFGELDVGHETDRQIFKHDAVTRGKKRENHAYKIFFVRFQGLPMNAVL